MGSQMSSHVKALVVMTVATGSQAFTGQFMPPSCTNSTPGPYDPKNCSLKAPDDPEFAGICHPGGFGHIGGAEQPVGRCANVKSTDGVFRCACCGAPLFYAASMFHPTGDGWPAFHGFANASVKVNGTDNVCSPKGSEVVCATCGAHLGDFFPAGTVADYTYYCIDGVCMLPPGAKEGQVCKPTQEPSYNGPSASARRGTAPIFA